MQTRADKIHARVNQKLVLGSRNLGEPTQEVKEKVGLIKALTDALFDPEGKFKLLLPLIQGTSLRRNLNVRQLELMRIIFKEILAETYGCGNCSEQASLSFLEFLKDPDFLNDGLNKSLEYLDVDCGGGRGHALLVLDRAASFSEEKPETWLNCQVFDTYNRAQVREFKEQGPKRQDLYNNPNVETAKLAIFLRLEKNLTPAEWGDLRIFLENFKKALTPSYLSAILTKAKDRATVHPEYFDSSKECERIALKLDENLACFAKLEKRAEAKADNRAVLAKATDSEAKVATTASSSKAAAPAAPKSSLRLPFFLRFLLKTPSKSSPDPNKQNSKKSP